MTLTTADLAVAIQTLHHSLCFSGDGFMYTKETRERVLNRLTEVMDSIDVEVIPSSADPGTVA